MKIFLILLLTLHLYAEVLDVGKKLLPISLLDQFGKKVEIKNQKFIVMSWDKKNSQLLNAFFSTHIQYMESKQIAYLVDISAIPSLIHKIFAKPKMKEFSFSIVQAEDEVYNRTFPYKENHITIIKLKYLQVQEILFIESLSTLDSILGETL